MKYLLLLISIYSSLSYAEEEDKRTWIMGKYSINLNQPCDVQVKVENSTQVISNIFGKNTMCNIATLSQTNIPNAFVIGGEVHTNY